MRKLMLALVLVAIAATAIGALPTKATKIQVWLTPMWKGVMDPSEPGADYDSFFKYAAAEFKKKYPNITVEVQVIPSEQRNDKLNVAMQTRTLPDVFYENSFAMTEFVYKGVMLPLDDIVDGAARSDIAPGIWNQVTVGKGIYFYPFSHMPGTLAYNADLFRKAGLDKYIGKQYDIATWSVDEFKTILQTLKAKVPEAAPFSLFAKNNQGDTWNLAYLRMFGSKFFDANSKVIVNDAAGVKALSFLVDLYKSGLTTPGAEALSSNDCNAMFVNQKVAISFTNSVLLTGQLGDMEAGKTPKFDLRLANIPGTPNPTTFTYVLGLAALDTGDKDRIEVAKAFIKYVATDPYLVKASKNGLPVRASVTAEVKGELPYLPAYTANSKYMVNFNNNVPNYVQLRNALFPELQAALMGVKTPQQALDAYAAKGNEIIQQGFKDAAIPLK